ncbi:hypothetical protein ABZS78_34515, partial [Streptomyces decoyicus]
RDFLDRIRVQTWMFAVPLLRREGDLRGHLWQVAAEPGNRLGRVLPARKKAVREVRLPAL